MTEPNPYAPPVAETQPAEPDPRAQRDANWALGLSLASMFCCPPPGLVAMFLAWRALQSRPSPEARRFAIAALILSILFSVLWLGLAIWQYLDPGPPRR